MLKMYSDCSWIFFRMSACYCFRKSRIFFSRPKLSLAYPRSFSPSPQPGSRPSARKALIICEVRSKVQIFIRSRLPNNPFKVQQRSPPLHTLPFLLARFSIKNQSLSLDGGFGPSSCDCFKAILLGEGGFFNAGDADIFQFSKAAHPLHRLGLCPRQRVLLLGVKSNLGVGYGNPAGTELLRGGVVRVVNLGAARSCVVELGQHHQGVHRLAFSQIVSCYF